MPKLKEFQKDICIKSSTIKGAGLGVFAKKFIPKGTLIGWYRGIFKTEEEWENTDQDQYIWRLQDEYDNDYYIDGYPIKKSNKLRYVNGARTPSQFLSINVEAYQSYDKIWYRTSKKINKGMELIVDYGDEYF